MKWELTDEQKMRLFALGQLTAAINGMAILALGIYFLKGMEVTIKLARKT